MEKAKIKTIEYDVDLPEKAARVLVGLEFQAPSSAILINVIPAPVLFVFSKGLEPLTPPGQRPTWLVQSEQLKEAADNFLDLAAINSERMRDSLCKNLATENPNIETGF